MAAVQALARASCTLADETAVHILTPFRQCLCCETAAKEVFVAPEGLANEKFEALLGAKFLYSGVFTELKVWC